ncbi:hypothetical protein GQ457_14G014010 [Hibiscus cannabinus]
MRMNNKHITFIVFQDLKCGDDSENCQVDDKLESILRMDLAQLCQGMNDANNISIDEHLEETIEDKQKSEPLKMCDKRLEVLKPSTEEPPELENYYNIELIFAASFDSKMGCLYSVFDVKKQGKPVWVVQARNWKLRGGENRLPGLLEGVSIASVGKARRQGGSNITFVQI